MFKYHRSFFLLEWAMGAIGIAISAAGIALYSRYCHPIWTDEFLHFAFGALSGTPEAWHAIVNSIGAFNFNQTGIYMLVDFWLLKLFGASALALRLPSLLSTAWLLACAATFFSVRGFNNFWKVILILALFAQSQLMEFAAEARPYMPLAAASVGALAFYATPVERRHGWLRAVGIVSIGLGVLMHPYFPVYWAAMICLGFLLALVEGRAPLAGPTILRFCDLKLVAAGLFTFLGVGALTWMRGSPALDFDPFQFIHRDQLIVTAVEVVHFNFIDNFGRFADFIGPRYMVLYLMIAPTLTYPFVPRRWRARLAALAPPLALALGALAISALLSWISYRHHYWILGRQWVASAALVPIAVVWYIAELTRQFGRWRDEASVILGTAFLCVICGPLWYVSKQKITILRQDVAAFSSSKSAGNEQPMDTAHIENDQWVVLANKNIMQGGRVWPIFRKYYYP